MYDISELLKLAALLTVRAEEATAKAAVHHTQGEPRLAAIEEKRAASGEHFADVCRYFHEKHSPKTRGPRKKAIGDLLAPFELFWNEYPKKRAKADAQRAWVAMKCEMHREPIMTALQRAKTSQDWQKEAGQFIPYPATWLRRAGWLDDIAQPRQAAPENEDHPRWRAFLKSFGCAYKEQRFAPSYLRDDFRAWLKKN